MIFCVQCYILQNNVFLKQQGMVTNTFPDIHRPHNVGSADCPHKDTETCMYVYVCVCVCVFKILNL